MVKMSLKSFLTEQIENIGKCAPIINVEKSRCATITKERKV